MTNPKYKFIIGAAVILAALGWLGFVGFQESKAYYITVTEFRDLETHSDFSDKTLKIAGDVVEGSIDRTKSPLQFAIIHEGHRLNVHYVGTAVLPDTFKDGSKAVVEGRIGANGTFEARHVEAKCASKYEAEYEQRST